MLWSKHFTQMAAGFAGIRGKGIANYLPNSKLLLCLMRKQVPWVEEYFAVPESPQCNICKHYEGYGICPAFPDGIPIELQTNKLRHTEVLAYDQEGKWVWEPIG
ncbi:MAG: hypothetical protein EOO06_14530 [Chitinophagaceae bacterium]|nr:MAG: hypothetical protein EOO06_14530 [Chitinophagaceae bacterium]